MADSGVEASKSVTEIETEKLRKRAKSAKRRRRKHSSLHALEKIDFNFDIPGVTKMAMNEATQKYMGCVVGEDITSENPWKSVTKELFEDNMELEENSEFLPIRLDILSYPKTEILVGYIPDEIREFDEFYIVLSENAEAEITEVIARVKYQQQTKLERSISKKTRPWRSLGSEFEIAEYTERNNRPLYEVEVEAAYPIASKKVHFRLQPAEVARDGYMELIQSRTSINVVNKRRIDALVQASPHVISSFAQTRSTYPKNAWTQYYYEYEKIQAVSANFTKNITSYVENNLDELCDQIRVNDHINFYAADYSKLVTDVSLAQKKDSVENEEYMSFADLNDARNKMISAVCWHPMWTGTVAIAYSNRTTNTYLKGHATEDIANIVVHGTNPVLIWCFNDGLKAKLYLESHRAVECISFCPFDENIVVAGCNNGQIIIWDIRNKLYKVEEEEILTTAQQKYRVLMYSLINWMKNTRNISRIRITAESDLGFSHEKPVTSINWLSPYWRVTKTGQLEEIGEDEPHTMQFATSSGDGSVMFWDLLSKPIAQASDYKPQRRSRRLKVRPSALTMDVSPFRMLNRILKPHYRLNMFSTKKGKPLLLTSLNIILTNIAYENLNPYKKYNLTERIEFKPVLTRPINPPTCELACATYDGYFMKTVWEGYDVNPGEIVNQEVAKVTSIGRYHDGPVCSIERHYKLQDVFLTVGGKVFAVWKDSFKDRPIFWRKSRHRYLHGSWCSSCASMIRVCRSDGNREIWYITKRTDKLYVEQNLSGDMILGSYKHPLKLPRSVLGIADFNGTFRMFYASTFMVGIEESECETLQHLLDREVVRKKAFLAWQENWLKNNSELLKEKQEKMLIKKQKKLDRELKEKQRILEEKLRQEKEEQRLAAQKMIPPPGQYLQWAQEQWRIKEEERMNKVLLVKKQLNPDLLVSQQMPLKNLEREEERKKKKQKERLQQSDKIFNESVAMLFPDVIKKKPPPPLDPYAGGEPKGLKQTCMEEYTRVVEDATDYIQNNVFKYDFNWKNVIQSGRARRRAIENQYLTTSHKDRRAFEIEAANQEFESTKVTVKVAKLTDDLEEDEEILQDEDMNENEYDETED